MMLINGKKYEFIWQENELIGTYNKKQDCFLLKKKMKLSNGKDIRIIREIESKKKTAVTRKWKSETMRVLEFTAKL